jgi:predicted transcriptional regulator
MVPSAFADDDSISLELSPVGAPEQGWYSIDDNFAIKGLLSNNGDGVTIDTDPSCGEVLKIWYDDLLVKDGTNLCRGQSRGLDISPNSQVELSTLTWDFTNTQGEVVSPGIYTIEYFIAGEGISESMDIVVLTPYNLPEGLELVTDFTARNGVHEAGAPSVLSAKIHNTLDSSYSFPIDYCKININSNLYNGCEGGFNLGPNQIMTLIQIPYDPVVGENLVTVSLGNNDLAQTFSFFAIPDSDDKISPNLEVDIVLDKENYGSLDTMTTNVQVSNQGDEVVTLDYSTTCRGEIWIIDSIGNVVLDTRSLKECNPFEMEHRLTNGDLREYNQPDWSFLDQNACPVTDGKLTIIAEIPEFDLYGFGHAYFFQGESNDCEQSTISIDSQIYGEDSLVVETMFTTDNVNDLTWISECGIEIIITQDSNYVDGKLSVCENDGMTIRIKDSEFIDASEFTLPDGDYTLKIISHSKPQITSEFDFSWPIILEDNKDEGVEEDDSVNLQESWGVSGSWSAITTDTGTCWILNSNQDQMFTLTGAPTILGWEPKLGWSGEYIVENSEDISQCSTFDVQSFTITMVQSETEPDVKPEENIEQVDEIVSVKDESVISPTIVSIGVVVATSSLLSILFATITTNESWRIPATSAGLWLLGLIGRTSETSDGRYQRGRLMGYLTANPGCHFRALMAALEMSNGQITHHLKVLETEDNLWRRADGRLVRFYPFTSNLHPGIDDDDLPLPPLSPDPNSLQGKILRLLDDDGQMGDFPTQSELATRLNRSQQLVSHHLRTLQKFGLVEKRKMGLRNRYRLTKEAGFLLETNDF